MCRMLVFSTISFTYFDLVVTHRTENGCMEFHLACHHNHDLIITTNATGSDCGVGDMKGGIT